MKGVQRPNFERKEIAKMKNGKTGRWRRSLLSIAFLIALSVVASSTVTAQVECLGRCEAQFAACLINSGRVFSQLKATCLESYELCVDNCLGGSAAVLV